MRNIGLRATSVAAMLLLGACATAPVPQYESSYENVQKLKAAGADKMSVERVAASGPKSYDTGISVRGNKIVSPVSGSYSAYLKQALEGELQRAELLSPAAALKITATIVENDIDAASGTGKGVLAAEFVVTADGTQRYRKVVRATNSWESSFVGAVAIPRAMESYPKTVGMLLASLYDDAEFIAAVKAPAPAAAATP